MSEQNDDDEFLLFQENSPFRKLPNNLNRPQMMSFDAIRYSIEMANISYLRLVATLEKIGKDWRETSYHPSLLLKISAMHDAWSIVDSSFRLRCLIETSPNLKKKGPGIQLFLRQTQGIAQLRNVVQHLNTEIRKLIELNVPAWGVLNWVELTDQEKMEIMSYTFIPGTLFSASSPVVNPAGKVFDSIIDHITLNVGEHSICLSDVFRSIKKLAVKFSEALENHIDPANVAGADVLLGLVMTFQEKVK